MLVAVVRVPAAVVAEVGVVEVEIAAGLAEVVVVAEKAFDEKAVFLVAEVGNSVALKHGAVLPRTSVEPAEDEDVAAVAAAAVAAAEEVRSLDIAVEGLAVEHLVAHASAVLAYVAGYRGAAAAGEAEDHYSGCRLQDSACMRSR